MPEAGSIEVEYAFYFCSNCAALVGDFKQPEKCPQCKSTSIRPIEQPKVDISNWRKDREKNKDKPTE